MASRYVFDIFEPGKDQDQSLNQLMKEFAPLHVASWQKNKQKIYQKDYDFNVTTFVAMWLNKNMKIFMAYDGVRAVGYLMGIVYRPLEYAANVFQVEDWYTDNNKEVEDGLFDYLYNATRILGCDELVIPQRAGIAMPDIGPWAKASESRLVRYTRK